MQVAWLFYDIRQSIAQGWKGGARRGKKLLHTIQAVNKSNDQIIPYINDDGLVGSLWSVVCVCVYVRWPFQNYIHVCSVNSGTSATANTNK